MEYLVFLFLLVLNSASGQKPNFILMNMDDVSHFCFISVLLIFMIFIYIIYNIFIITVFYTLTNLSNHQSRNLSVFLLLD